MPTKKNTGFSDVEKAAMKERARELKLQEKLGKDRAKGEQELMSALGKLSPADRKMGQRLHELITETAPQLMPKTMYGMPAYANADGKVIVFYQAASKYESRYNTLGFNDSAMLDDGNMWPTSFALIKLTAAEEAKIVKLVKKALG